MSPPKDHEITTLYGDFIFRFKDESRNASVVIRTKKLYYEDSNSSLTKELIRNERENANKNIDSFWRKYV